MPTLFAQSGRDGRAGGRAGAGLLLTLYFVGLNAAHYGLLLSCCYAIRFSDAPELVQTSISAR